VRFWLSRCGVRDKKILKLAVFGVQVDTVLIEEFNRRARGERRDFLAMNCTVLPEADFNLLFIIYDLLFCFAVASGSRDEETHRITQARQGRSKIRTVSEQQAATAFFGVER